MNDENRRSIAIEEIKILSSIIGRIENAIHQRLAWLFALITGLTLALMKNPPIIRKNQFFAISFAVTIVFWIADAIQRVPVHRAIERSREVERSLRDNQYVNCPLISDSLSNGNCCDFFHTAFRPRVLAWYLATGAVVGIISYLAP
jgi:hypothetical protein